MSERLKEGASLDEYELVAVPIEEYKYLKETERKYEELRETIFQFFKNNNADLKEQIKEASQQTSLREEIARIGNQLIIGDINYANISVAEMAGYNNHVACPPFDIMNFLNLL